MLDNNQCVVYTDCLIALQLDRACEVALKAYYDMRVFRSDMDNQHSMQYITEVRLYIIHTVQYVWY